jgi:hypothetical protein
MKYHDYKEIGYNKNFAITNKSFVTKCLFNTPNQPGRLYRIHFEIVNNLEYRLLQSRNRLSRKFNLKNRLGTCKLVESSQQPINGNPSSHSKLDFSLKTGFFTNLLRSTLLSPAGPGPGEVDRLG